LPVIITIRNFFISSAATDHFSYIELQVDHPELVQRFIVEKRTADNGWAEISSMDAVDTRYTYGATDPAPSWGNNFYRLKIVEKIRINLLFRDP